MYTDIMKPTMTFVTVCPSDDTRLFLLGSWQTGLRAHATHAVVVITRTCSVRAAAIVGHILPTHRRTVTKNFAVSGWCVWFNIRLVIHVTGSGNRGSQRGFHLRLCIVCGYHLCVVQTRPLSTRRFISLLAFLTPQLCEVQLMTLASPPHPTASLAAIMW